MQLTILIAHLVSVIIGAGGAFFSDVVFFVAIFDNRIDFSEYRILKIASKVVQTGLVMLYITGGLLLATGSETSSRFWAKMSIVMIITVVGFIMHRKIFPVLRRCVAEEIPINSAEILKHAPLAVTCGLISIISWTSAVVLGAWRTLDIGYFEIMQGYGLFVLTSSVWVNIAVYAAVRSPSTFANIYAILNKQLNTICTLPAVATEEASPEKEKLANSPVPARN